MIGKGVILGGPLRKAGHNRDWRKNFGRLRWTRWNSTDGRATGALWQDNCRPDCAAGTFLPTEATVHAYRLNGSFVFTRLTVHAGRYNFTSAPTAPKECGTGRERPGDLRDLEGRA
jgi:hypothetical protein